MPCLRQTSKTHLNNVNKAGERGHTGNTWNWTSFNMCELRMQRKRARCFVPETTSKVTILTALVMSQKSPRNWDNTAYKLWSNLWKITFTWYWLACGCRGCYLCLHGYLPILEGWGTELDTQGMTSSSPPPPPPLLYAGNIVEMEIQSCKKNILEYHKVLINYFTTMLF